MSREVISRALVEAKWGRPPFTTSEGCAVLPVRHKAKWSLSNRGTRHLTSRASAVWRDGHVVYGIHWACGDYGGHSQFLADALADFYTCERCSLVERYADAGPVVYRYTTPDGDLLYVGSTGNLPSRVYAHRRSPWWSDDALLSFEHHATLPAARAAEALAILADQPRHNVRGRRQHRLGAS